MRSLVEHALVLDLPRLMRRGWIRDGHTGRVILRFSQVGDRIAVSYRLIDAEEAWLQLRYTRNFFDGGRREISQYVPLEMTEPHFGGRRWWMSCPSCGRRVSKIYLPPGGDTFACRNDWRLVYESQRRDSVSREIARLDRIRRQL
jgi:hypothetical protein